MLGGAGEKDLRGFVPSRLGTTASNYAREYGIFCGLTALLSLRRARYGHMEIRRSQHNYFDDIVNYLITLISVTLTAELYIRGSAGKYLSNHTLGLQTKQTGRWLRFYPYTLLDDFFRSKWPTTLSFEEEEARIPPADAVLKLGMFEKPLLELTQLMFVNYFERRRPDIETQYGEDTTSWPQDWNFGRVVRNSFVHKAGV